MIGQALLEARSALNSLRASIAQTTDLAEDLRRVADVGASPSAMSVSFSVSGEPREFHPIVRDEVCGIGSEAIRNALAHSMARQLLVTVDYERDMTLRVQDDGVGIERDMLATGKSGHFGLAGMRERAARIGAKLTIATDPGAGTDITLVVARNIAFKDGRRVRHRFFRRRIGPRG